MFDKFWTRGLISNQALLNNVVHLVLLIFRTDRHAVSSSSHIGDTYYTSHKYRIHTVRYRRLDPIFCKLCRKKASQI